MVVLLEEGWLGRDRKITNTRVWSVVPLLRVTRWASNGFKRVKVGVKIAEDSMGDSRPGRLLGHWTGSECTRELRGALKSFEAIYVYACFVSCVSVHHMSLPHFIELKSVMTSVYFQP